MDTQILENTENLSGSKDLAKALNDRVYLDHNATTPISSSILNQASKLLEIWGNPSSIHASSRHPKMILRETRKKLSEYLKCSPLEIIFNSGASEGNSTVLKSVWQYYFNLSQQSGFDQANYRDEYLISKVEHPSVIQTAKYLESLGAKIIYIPVLPSGDIDLEFIKKRISPKTALVSVMMANNETGTLYPLTEIVKLAKLHQILVHSDAVQMLGKRNFNIQDTPVDYLTLSAHKFYAAKGVGILYVRKNSPYVNLVHGGGQERSRRGGTENIFGLSCLNIMLDQLSLIEEKEKEISHLRNYFEAEIEKKINQIFFTARSENRLCNTTSLVISGVDGETLLMSLDLRGFSVSTGAACSSGNPEPSPVLLALGLSRDQAQSSLRVSLGWQTTKAQIDLFIEVLTETVIRLRELNNDHK